MKGLVRWGGQGARRVYVLRARRVWIVERVKQDAERYGRPPVHAHAHPHAPRIFEVHGVVSGVCLASWRAGPRNTQCTAHVTARCTRDVLESNTRVSVLTRSAAQTSVSIAMERAGKRTP